MASSMREVVIGRGIAGRAAGSLALANLAVLIMAIEPAAGTIDAAPEAAASVAFAAPPPIAPASAPIAPPPIAPASAPIAASIYQSPPSVESQSGGFMSTIRLVGDIAWVGVGPRLISFDIGDPSNPQVIGRSAVMGAAVADVAIPSIEPNGAGGSPDVAWLALAQRGIAAVRIEDPRAPVSIAYYQLDYPLFVAAVNDHVWVVTRDGDLKGYDAGDPAQLRPAGTLAAPTDGPVRALAARDGHLILAADAYSEPQAPVLFIVDVRDPDHPAVVGTLPSPGPEDWSVSDVAVADGVVWLLGDYPCALVAVDVSSPPEPKVISYFAHGDIGSANWLTVADGLAHMTGGDGGHNYFYSYVVHVDDPSSPRLLGGGHLPLPVDPTGARAATGTTLWLGFYDGHLLALDASNPDPEPHYPRVDFPTVGTLLTIGPLDLIDVVDHSWLPGQLGSLGVAGLGESIVTLDLSVPRNEAPIAHALLGSYPSAIDIEGDTAWVTTWGTMDVMGEELHALALDDPTSPARIGPTNRIGATRVAVDGERAVVIHDPGQPPSWDQQLGLLDVSNPVSPSVLGAVYDGRGFQDAELWANLVFGVTPRRWRGTDFGLVVADAPAGSPMRVLGELPLGTPAPEGAFARIAVADGYVYEVVNRALHVVDVGDPASPKEAAYAELACDPRSIAYDGGYLFMADSCGVTMYDVREPDRPTPRLTVYTIPGGAYDAQPHNHRVYVASGAGGLYVVKPTLVDWATPPATPSSVPPPPPGMTATATTSATAGPSATSTNTPTPTSTATPPHTSTPVPLGRACEFIRNRVPAVAIHWALANPERVYGWDQLVVPGLPPSPANPRKRSLSLRNVAMPYDSDFNPLVYKAGCP